MEFGIIASRADIRIDAAELRIRALAPAIVVERVDRRVERDIAFCAPNCAPTARRPNEPTMASISRPGKSKPFFISIEIAPPIAFNPKIGLLGTTSGA